MGGSGVRPFVLCARAGAAFAALALTSSLTAHASAEQAPASEAAPPAVPPAPAPPTLPAQETPAPPSPAPASPAPPSPAPPSAAPPAYPGFPPFAPPPPPGLPMVIIGAPRVPELELDFAGPSGSRGVSRAYARCSGDCTLFGPPGSYVLRVRESQDLLGGQRAFELDEPSLIRVVPRSRSGRTSGLILGVTGIALLVGGVGVVVAADSLGGSSSQDGTELFGVLGIAAGAVLTPFGWAKFGRSAPEVNVEPLYSPR